MLKRLVFPVVVLACAGLAAAQNTTDKQPAKPSKPAATSPSAPSKTKETPTGTQPKDKGKDKEKDKKEAAKSLNVGDAAPSITVEKWIKGEPVTGFEKGKVYVVEFWATWCPPCRKSIPHLTELQKAHKELTVIGVTSSEKADKDGADNRLPNLEKFVSEQGANMDYRVAYDSDRDMAANWLQAAGKGTIPTAFIVNAEGKVAWIGNPLDKAFDTAVEKELKSKKNGLKKDKDKDKDSDTGSTKPKKDDRKK